VSKSALPPSSGQSENSYCPVDCMLTLYLFVSVEEDKDPEIVCQLCVGEIEAASLEVLLPLQEVEETGRVVVVGGMVVEVVVVEVEVVEVVVVVLIVVVVVLVEVVVVVGHGDVCQPFEQQ
jgi:hypothetical protein